MAYETDILAKQQLVDEAPKRFKSIKFGIQ